jgi:DNA (cytosine-5)-methyltransferase 1
MRLLDLFCGVGGASMGYSQAGFEVVGVDIHHQPDYPFEFKLSDCLELSDDFIAEFDVIHASPPCQHFTKYNNTGKDFKKHYEDLLVPTRDLLSKSNKITIMENVVGAPLINPIKLCGSMFGLDVQRHRLFESNQEYLEQPKCDHSVWESNRFPGGRSIQYGGHARFPCRATVEIGRWNIPLKVQQEAMGIDWTKNLKSISEAVPPAYTRFLGIQIINQYIT